MRLFLRIVLAFMKLAVMFICIFSVLSNMRTNNNFFYTVATLGLLDIIATLSLTDTINH